MSESFEPAAIIPKERDVSSHASPGLRLKRAREMAKMDITSVARQLYLSEDIIHAIERDLYEKLPGLMFAKGYMRSYAKLVNISPDDVIKSFNDLGLTEEQSTHFPVPLFKAHNHTIDRYIRWVTYGLAAVLILLFLMWWQSSRKPSAGVTANPAASAAPHAQDSQHSITTSLSLPPAQTLAAGQNSENAALPNTLAPNSAEMAASTSTTNHPSINSMASASLNTSANIMTATGTKATANSIKDAATPSSAIVSNTVTTNTQSDEARDTVNANATDAVVQKPKANKQKKSPVVLNSPFE